MGWLSKVWKGVKKTVKKIGKGIKSAFKSVGKFMGKLGIVGQIGLGLLLPGLGQMLGTWAVTAMGSANALVAGAGHFVNAAIQIGTKASSVFKTVTQGVTKVIGQTVGTVLNKIPGAGDLIKDLTLDKIDITQMKNFTGDGGVFDTVSKVMTDVADSGRDLVSMDTLTAKNKLGQDLIDKTQAAIAKTTTATPVEIQDQLMQSEYTETNLPSAGKIDLTKSRLEEFKVSPEGTEFIDGVPVRGENFTDKESLLGKAPTVKLDVAADTTIVPVDATEAAVDVVEKDAGYYENLRNKVADEYKKFRADPLGVEGLSGRVTDGIGTQFMQGLGLENKPKFTSVDNRSSNNFNFGGLQASTSIRTGKEAFDPLAYSQNADYLSQNTIGFGAHQWDANREYVNRMRGL